MTPLISCIMPIADRPAFAEKAIYYWTRQTWSNRELVIVDNGAIALPEIKLPGVRLIRTGPKSIGELRNIACDNAQGRMIAHWDSDDYSHPNRLAEQADLLMAADCDVVGYRTLVFWNKITDEWWLYDSDMEYAVGTSLFYKKETWLKRRFPAKMIAEDNAFLVDRHLVTASGHRPLRMIAIHHRGCVSMDREFDGGRRGMQTCFTRITSGSECQALKRLLRTEPIF